eukprot:7243677-Pyramimonas_sp.AAC.1
MFTPRGQAQFFRTLRSSSRRRLTPPRFEAAMLARVFHVPHCGFARTTRCNWGGWGGPNIRSLELACLSARVRAASSTFEWQDRFEPSLSRCSAALAYRGVAARSLPTSLLEVSSALSTLC